MFRTAFNFTKIVRAFKKPSAKYPAFRLLSTASTATTSVDKDIYVLTVHQHDDCYKRADSSSKTLGAFTNLRDAHFTAIRILVSKHFDSQYMKSAKLLELIPSLDHEDEEEWLLFQNSTVEEVLAKIHEFDDNSLKDIYEELCESLAEEEPEFTMRPYQTSVTVSKLDFIETIETGKYTD